MALIIRPNSGINNAVAGLAAGFGQGMQLGMEAQKIQLAREKQEAELRFAEQRAALELAAEERAKTTFGQQQELFGQAQAERAAAKEAMGLLGQAADLRGQIQGGVANMPGAPLYQDQSGPQQSNMYTGAPYNPYAAFNSMMGRLVKKGQYAGVQQNYEKAMQQAGALAGKMNPEMADRYLKEVERRQLLAADDQARQAFADHIANVESSGGLTLLDPMGNRVKDPQMDATVRSLVEQSGNRNVNLSKLQEQFDTLLGKVNANNTKARTTQFELGTIEQNIATAMQAGNGGAVTALEEARGAISSNPYLSEKEKSDLLSNAKNGRVPVLINGKQEWVNAANKAEETAKLQDYADRMKALEEKLKAAQVGKTEAEADYLNRRETGMTTKDAINSSIRAYSALNEDQKAALEEQGITQENYISQLASQFISGERTLAGGGATTAKPSNGAQKGLSLTPEEANTLRKEADALGLTDPTKRQEYGRWRTQNPRANPSDFGKAMRVTDVVQSADGKTTMAVSRQEPGESDEVYAARQQFAYDATSTESRIQAAVPQRGGKEDAAEYRKQIAALNLRSISNESEADAAIKKLQELGKFYRVKEVKQGIELLEQMKRKNQYPALAMPVSKEDERLEKIRQKEYEKGMGQKMPIRPAE